MNGRFGSVLRAIGGLVLTLALVVGVPFFLIVGVGNPLPSSVPSIDEIRILLTQNGQGFSNFLIGALAIIIWLIWLQLIVALVVELVATIRQSETRRLPTAPGIQALAAKLVASMTLVTTLATGPAMAPALGALTFDGFDTVASTVQVELDVHHQIVQARGTAPEADAAQAVAAEPAVQVVVDDHSELWDIAEAAYGDGVSWKTIAEANAGLADADGRMITPDTESVPPGTALRLVGAVDTAAVAVYGDVEDADTGNKTDTESETDIESNTAGVVEGDASASKPSETHDQVVDAPVVNATPVDQIHVVQPGDSMWSLAEEVVEQRSGTDASDAEIAQYWVDVVDVNKGQISSGDADLIYPGEELTLPDAAPATGLTPGGLGTGAEQADAPTESATDALGAMDVADGPADNRSTLPPTSAPAESPATAESQANVAGARESAESAEAESPGFPVAQLGLAAFGMALLSTGVIGAIRRRRDMQRRTRTAGSLPQQPSTEAAAFEAALAHSADAVQASQHGTGWRLLPAEAVAAVRSGGPMQVHAAPDGVLRAVSIADKGDAWESRKVTLSSELDSNDVATALDLDDVVVERSLADVEVDAAPLPTTMVIGTDTATGEAVLVDLASAEALELRGEPADVRRFAKTAVLDLAVSERADDLCVITVGIGAELSDLERVRVTDTYADALVQAVRCGHARDDSTTPVVVIAAQAPSEGDQSLEALFALGANIVAPGIESALRLTLSGDQGKLWPAGTSVVLSSLASDEYAAVAELVDATAIDSSEPVSDTFDVAEAVDVPVVASCPIEPGPVEVRVLGPVDVAGASSFSSLKAIDVVCYLAFHRQGVDADQIKSWVWPPFDPPTDKAFANVLSRARTGLGTTDDGTPYLSRAGADKTYRLADEVTTDFDRFRATVELANTSPDKSDELAYLKQALDLIRGVPFTGGSASSFAWADNHVRAHVEFTIDEAVHRCADLALELDDLVTARWAALKGLELVPGCEQCYKRRFLVAGAGNNRTELRRAMEDLERSAAADLGEPEAVDTISGDLLDLYHELDQTLVAGSS